MGVAGSEDGLGCVVRVVGATKTRAGRSGAGRLTQPLAERGAEHESWL